MIDDNNMINTWLRKYEASLQGEFSAYQLGQQNETIEAIKNRDLTIRDQLFNKESYTERQQELYVESFQKGIELIIADMQHLHVEKPNEVKRVGNFWTRGLNCMGELEAIEYANELNFNKSAIEEILTEKIRAIQQFEAAGEPAHYRPFTGVRETINGVIIGLKRILAILDNPTEAVD